MKKTVIMPAVPARIRRISPWYYGAAAVVVLVAAWVVCYAPRTIVVRDTQNYGTSFTADARLVLRDQDSTKIVYKDFSKVTVDSKGYKISYTPGWFELPRNLVADVCFKRGTAVGGDKLDSIPYCEGAVAPAKYVGYVIRSCDNHYVPWALFSFSRTVEFSGLCNGQGQNLALASQIQDAAAVVAGEKDDNTTVIAGDTNGDGKVDGDDKKDGDNNSDSDTDNDNRTSLYVTNPTTTVTNRVDMQECEDDEVLVWDDNRWNCRDVDDLVTAGGGGGSGPTGNFTDLFVTNNTTLNNLTTTGTSTFGGPTIFNSTTTFTTLPSIPLAPGNLFMGDVSGVGAPFAPGANGEVLTIVAGVPTWTPASGGGPTGDLVAGSNVVFAGSGVGKLVGATNVTVGISATPSFTSLTTTTGPNNLGGTTNLDTLNVSGPVSFTGPTFTTSVGTTTTFNGPTNVNNTFNTSGPNNLGGVTTINDLNVTGTTTFVTAPNIPLPTDNIWVGNGSNVATPIVPGAAGQVLTIVGTTPTWAAPSGGGVTFTLAGSAGASSVISGGDTLSVLAGTNMVTTGNGTDGVTVATVANPSFTSLTTTAGPNSFGGNSTFGGPVTFNSTATFTTAPSIPLATGSIFVGNGANLAAAYGPGANGEVLTVVAGIPTWQPAGGSGTTALSALTPAVANNTINNGTFTQNWNFNSGGSLNLRQSTGTTSNGLFSVEASGVDIVSVPGDIQGIANIWNSRTTSNDIALSLRTNGAASQGTSLYLDNEGSGYLIYANDNGGVGAGLNADTTPFVLDASGNVGIGVAAPTTKLQVTSTAANTSGVRLTNLTSASPTSVGQAIGVDASGNIVTVAGAVAPCVSTSNTICNGGNNTGGTFIGTTDNQPLQFLANGTNTWKITPDVVTGGRLSTNISNPISVLTNSNTTYTAQNGVSTNGPNSFVWEQNTAGGYGSAAQYAAVIAQTSLTSGSSLLLKAFRADNQTYLINANAGLGAGTDVFSVTSLGRVGINNNAPAQALDVNGTIRQTGAVSCTLMTNASGDIICTSDETRKDISGFYTNGLDKLRQVNPIAFNYKGEDAPRVGFSAQNIRSVLPEGAPIQRDGSLGLDSNAVVALTVSAVKDLDAVVTEQGKAIAELQAKRGIATDGSAVPADVVDQLSKLDASSQTFQTELGTLFDAVTDQQETLNDLLATLSDLQIDVRDLRVDVATLQAEVKALANGGNSKITAKTQFTSDVVGRTEVKKGDTKVRIKFENKFDEKPVITITPHNIVSGGYAINNVQTDEFEIELADAQGSDVTFDWHAFDGGAVDTQGDSSGAAPVAPATTEPTPADPPLSDPLVPVGIE